MKRFSNHKTLAWCSVVIFVFSMLPVWYLAFYARPSGDDYGYSVLTHAAWLDTHSLWEVCKAGAATVKKFYIGWNGDWFSTFLFSLMPEVFAPWSFWTGVILMTLLLIGSTTVFCYELMVKNMRMPAEDFVILDMLLLFMSYQFIPSTAIGMYWYVGAVHYIMPHSAALLAIAATFRFYRTGKKPNILYAALCAVAVGGSSYFSSLLLFMVWFVFIVVTIRKRKAVIWLGLPFLVCLAGFVVQCISPGNAVRAGEGFGFSAARAGETIVTALVSSVTALGAYARDKMLVYSLLVVFGVAGWAAMRRSRSVFRYPYPLLFCIFMFGCYSGMYAPEIYSGVEVSLGPATIEYLTFLLAAGACILYCEGWLLAKSRRKGRERTGWAALAGGICIAAGMLPALIWHGWYRNATDVRAYEYIASGQAEDFREQMKQQMEVFLDDSVKDARVVMASDRQGPLMHMPLTDDEEAFTNRVARDFYRKDRVLVKTE